MTRNPIRRSGLVLLSLLLPLSPLSAEDEKDLRELLRDALYTEEVTRDPEAAAKQYEALLSQHDAQRAFAASALFRLAEVRRKQDRKEEAIALYQKLLTRFPEAGTEAKLARESLAALGGQIPSAGSQVGDSEDQYIEKLRKIAETSPDRLQEELYAAVNNEKPKVVEFLISQGADPKAPNVLSEAAADGNLTICKILLQHGKPLPVEAGNALAMAISKERGSVLNYLLEQGLDPNAPVSWGVEPLASPLMVAIHEDKADAAKALLDRGANVDFMVQSEGYPSDATRYFGTPLHDAVWRRNLPMFRLLLERGAKPDLPTPNAGITPLHLAASLKDPIAETMVKELLAHGADPNRKTTLPLPDTRKPNQAPRAFALVTPLEIAFENEAGAPLAEAMFAKGASVNIFTRTGQTWLGDAVRNRSPERVKYQLKAGADPDMAGKDGWTPLMLAAQGGEEEMTTLLLEAGADPNKGHDGATPLSIASKGGLGWRVVKILFARGAKPETVTFQGAITLSEWDFALKLLEGGAPLPSDASSFPWEAPLVVAMRSPDALPLIEKMIAMGAKLDEGWIKSGFQNTYYSGKIIEVSPEVRSFLFHRFTLPQFEDSPAIRLAVQDAMKMRVFVLDDPSPPHSPVPFAQSLLDPTETLDGIPKILPSDLVTIWRKSGENWAAAAEFQLGTKEDFPVLQRGDVVELTDGNDPGKRRGQLSGMANVLSPELRWSLRKRISFPITVENAGKTQEVTLRGDRLIFDPATPSIVPLGGARSVMRLLWQPEVDWEGVTLTGSRSVLDSTNVVIRRDGWPDIRLPFSASGKDFPLRAGDRLSLESPEVAAKDIARRRKERVAVRAAGGLIVRHFGKNYIGINPDPRTIPSLLQAVVEVTQVAGMKDAPRDASALPAWLMERQWAQSFIQRPDLSKIRVLRVQEDGSEKVIDVDLAKIIADTPEDATIETVRKADMTLVAGDIVDIPIVSAEEVTPPGGLTSREETFLSKALSCRIQVSNAAGDIRVQEVRYRAPQIIATDAGPIPVPAPESVPSLNGSASLSNSPGPKTIRDGLAEAQIEPWELFLKEGDRFNYPAQANRRIVPPPAPPVSR